MSTLKVILFLAILAVAVFVIKYFIYPGIYLAKEAAKALRIIFGPKTK